jgi:hypothetical protein
MVSSSILGRWGVGELVGCEGVGAGPVPAFDVAGWAADPDPAEGELPPQPPTPTAIAATSAATLMILLARFTVLPRPCARAVHPTQA